MGDFYLGYTLGDIVGLAHEHIITYQECAEILEMELQQRFPWIKPEIFYSKIKQEVVGQLDYCEKLVRVGGQLEKIMRN